MPDASFDPLAGQRAPADPELDVLIWGTVFLDIIFAGMSTAPSPGTEVIAEGMASCPGGIANLAIAARRLGLRTSLAAAFSEDDYGAFCWSTLAEQEQVDLRRSRRFADWHSPVTVSMSHNRDRSMVTHAHPAPMTATELIGQPPRSRAAMVDLVGLATGEDHAWVGKARAAGAMVFADVGWDPDELWAPEVLDGLSQCHAFLPNAVEAMSYTRTSTPRAALYDLADRVPLAVVTAGADGAMAIDATTGEEAQVPAVLGEALDPTGAGDVFAAAMVMGTLASWPLGQRLAFAALAASLALQQFGGSLAAPGWGDVVDWWQGLRSSGIDDAYHRSLRRRYGFLDDIVPRVPMTACRRASATVARLSDVDGLS